jgi:hypothetical protein
VHAGSHCLEGDSPRIIHVTQDGYAWFVWQRSGVGSPQACFAAALSSPIRIGLLVGCKTSEAATGAADRSRICAENTRSRQWPCEDFVHVVLVDAQYTDVAVDLLIRRRGLPAKAGCNYFQGGSWRSRREIKYFCR